MARKQRQQRFPTYSPAVARGLALASQKAFAPKPSGWGLHTPFGTVHIPQAATSAITRVALNGVPGLGLAMNFAAPRHYLEKELGRTAQDAVDLPQGIASSTYQLGHALIADPSNKELKGIWKSLKHTDPILLAAQGKFGKALDQVQRHPLNAALEIGGVKGGIGRGITHVEGAARGLAGQEPGAMFVRDEARVPHTNIAQRRRYSEDVFKRASQKRSDRKGLARAIQLREQAAAREQAGNTAQAAELRARADHADPRVITGGQRFHRGGEMQTQMHEQFGSAEEIRRAHRAQAVNVSHKITKGAPRSKATLSLVSQGIVRNDPKDIAAYHDLIAHAHAHEDLTSAKKLDNEALRANILEDLKTREKGGRRQKGSFDKAAAAYNEFMAPVEKELGHQGLLPPQRAETARLVSYAVRRMGARHNAKAEATDLAAGENAAMAARHGATGELNDAYKTAAIAHQRLAGMDGKGGKQLAKATLDVRNADARVAEAVKAHAVALTAHKTAKLEAAGRAKTFVPGLVDAAGRPLRAGDIRAHMQAHGQAEPSYLPQGPTPRGAKNFFVSGDKPVTLGARTRTGEAVRQGTLDASPQLMMEHAAHQVGVLDATRMFRGIINHFGVRGADGKIIQASTRDEITKVARNLEASTSTRWRPVRMNPWGGSEAQLSKLLDDVNPADAHQLDVTMHDAMSSALTGADGKGSWTLIPEEAAKTADEHMKVSGTTGGKAFQFVNTAFRKTVLTTSVKWLTGNVAEALFRSAVMGVGPRDYLFAHRVLKELSTKDPAAYEQTLARTSAGGHLSMAERVAVHRAAEQFTDSRLEGLANAMAAVARHPGGREVVAGYHAYTQFVLRTVNGRVESSLQRGMLGKAMRTDLLDRRIGRISDRAVTDAMNGMRNTAAQNQMGRIVDRAYGKYSKFSPTERRVIANYTPFIAWTVNAIKFLGDVLPRDHPTLTALLVAQNNASREWRKQYGLAVGENGQVPDWLLGAVPIPGGGMIRVSRYLPMGVASDPLQIIAGSVLPQFQSTLNAFYGLDWNGHPLKPGVSRVMAGVKAFVGSTVPAFGQSMRIAQGKGPIGARLKREFDPANPVSGSMPTQGGQQNVDAPKGSAEDEITKALQKTASSSGSSSAQDEVMKALQKTAGR